MLLIEIVATNEVVIHIILLNFCMAVSGGHEPFLVLDKGVAMLARPNDL
jgi:hypothetical protein